MRTIDSIALFVLKLLMGISGIVLSAVTFLQVIARYIFSSPIAWGQDIIRLSFIYLVFFGAAFCVSSKEHLNIDVLTSRLSGGTAKAVSLLIDIILLSFFVFLIYYGYDFTLTGVNQMAPYLRIPMALYYVSLPTSAIFMAYFQLRNIAKSLTRRDM